MAGPPDRLGTSPRENNGMMASAKPASMFDSAATRPRLQAINQDFPQLEDQIRQATHIIGLPDNWNTLKDQSARAAVAYHINCARAEWVLRWLLDKLKDETDAGATARAHPVTWQLMEWMIYVLPVSRSTPHLRNASLPGILEKTLFAQFDRSSDASTGPGEDVHMEDVSDSNDTLPKDSTPSRKRKRGVEGISSTQVTNRKTSPSSLFQAIRAVVAMVVSLASKSEKLHETTRAELMKMILRTESAQAARILRFWLEGVTQLLKGQAAHSLEIDDILDLSLVVDIWDVRIINPTDEVGGSVDEFSTECLIPALTLLETLGSLRKQCSIKVAPNTVDRATRTLDKLVAKHLLAPSRADFFANVSEEPGKPASERGATLLSSNLEPLRASLLQAAQIEDAGEQLPAELALLFNAVPLLLDVAIRASPLQSPKGKIAEKPWIHAAFASLASCAGCALDAPPQYVLHETAIGALEGALRVLQTHSVSVSPKMLEIIFWYYGGVKYPEDKEKQIHWSLITSLIKLDASIFVGEPKTNLKLAREKAHSDLTEFIFDRVSVEEVRNPGLALRASQLGDAWRAHSSNLDTAGSSSTESSLILDRIVIPLMSAFVRNRNLLGFIRRWDQQLVKSYRYETLKVLKKRQDRIWEHRALSQALKENFEQSLTQGQIATLVEEHAQRIAGLGDVMETAAKDNVYFQKLAGYRNAASSSFIVPAILQAIRSDDTIEALRSHLESMFRSFTLWVQDDRFSRHLPRSQSWLTLSQLLVKLWPIELHRSPSLQEDLLGPLIPSALNDISGSSKRRIDSSAQTAAMLFLLNACTYMRKVPEFDTIIQSVLGRIMQVLSDRQLDSLDHDKMVEMLCAHYVDLFGYLEASECEESLHSLLSKLADVDESTSSLMLNALSHSIIHEGSILLKKAYYKTLINGLSEIEGRLYDRAIQALSFVHPVAFSREQREAILDQAVELICSKPKTSIELLSIITHLMEVPNATAKISTDSEVIFTVAEKLHEHGHQSPATLQQLRQLVDSVLGHMIPNETQAKNKAFLKSFAEKLDMIATASRKCSAARLSILRATVLAQRQSKLLDPLQYVELLKHCLTDDSSAETPSLPEILEAFNELPLATLQALNIYDTTRAWLRIWINDNSDFESYMASNDQSSPELAEFVARLHMTVARFRLYPSVKWFLKLTLIILHEPLTEEMKTATYEAFHDALSPLCFAEKFDLITTLTQTADPLDQPFSYRLLKNLAKSLPDKLEDNADLKQKQLTLLPSFCVLVAQTTDHSCFHSLLDSINTILVDKPALTSQYSIECVLDALLKLASRTSPCLPTAHAPSIFARLCETTRLVLLLHRSRLGGRFHLLLPLLQALLFCLFVPNTPRSGALPPWLRPPPHSNPIRLTPANASHLTRVLATLCNPPQSAITKAHQHQHQHQNPHLNHNQPQPHDTDRASKELNDPVRAARDRTAAFLYPLLASFCRFQLAGRLDAGVRDKLMPGVWEVVGTAALHKEVLEAMFAGLGRSERDVWRGVWGEWERVNGKKKGVVAVE